MSLLHPFPKEVYRKDPEHQYFHNDGRKFISVSRLLGMYSESFDAKKMSVFSAKKKSKETGILVTAAEVEKQWNDYGKERADIGTVFHDAMEQYLKIGQIVLPKYERQIKRLAKLFLPYYQTYAEVIVYDENAGVAGALDTTSLHSVKSRNILHIKDFKTNEKGIHNVYEYGKWMYKPLDHLVDNKFTRYSLQQSLYGAMLESHGFKIATLSLIWIDLKAMERDEEIFWVEIPVPYLKHEAFALLEEASMSVYY